jgi:hypothetical protein
VFSICVSASSTMNHIGNMFHDVVLLLQVGWDESHHLNWHLHLQQVSRTSQNQTTKR